jgi:NitT/TauT family transport system permease protein
VWLSTWIAALGLFISIVVGMALGIAMSQARWVERSIYPYAVILQCIPTLALVPVIGFWFDFGLPAG